MVSSCEMTIVTMSTPIAAAAYCSRETGFVQAILQVTVVFFRERSGQDALQR